MVDEAKPPPQLFKLSDLGDGPPAATPSVGTATSIQKDYDPTPDQEKARANIAYVLLWTLVGIIAFLVVVSAVLAQDCFTSTTCDSAKNTVTVVIELMNIVYTPIVGLVGSVIGFYFGSKAASGK